MKGNPESHPGSPYREAVLSLLGKEVEVIVDRPVGFRHGDILYPLNYGYIEGLLAPDGEFQDAYVLEATTPLEQIKGKVIAIVHRKDDIEDKLVVSPSGTPLSEEEIKNLVSFQERYFSHVIVTLWQKADLQSPDVTRPLG